MKDKTQKPKIAPEAPVRIIMECRVCGALLESYVLEDRDDPREATLHDAAFLCANKMEKHLIEKHNYSKGI